MNIELGEATARREPVELWPVVLPGAWNPGAPFCARAHVQFEALPIDPDCPAHPSALDLSSADKLPERCPGKPHELLGFRSASL